MLDFDRCKAHGNRGAQPCRRGQLARTPERATLVGAGTFAM